MSHGGGDSGRWLVSYADLITLMMALFLVLYTMGQVDIARYRALAEAFRDALRSLGVRERSLLLYQVVEGLSVEEIAVLYRVHRVTVSRWLGATRARLLKTTRQNLMQRLHIGDLEVESLLRLINSQMEITLDRCLREDPP